MARINTLVAIDDTTVTLIFKKLTEAINEVRRLNSAAPLATQEAMAIIGSGFLARSIAVACSFARRVFRMTEKPNEQVLSDDTLEALSADLELLWLTWNDETTGPEDRARETASALRQVGSYQSILTGGITQIVNGLSTTGAKGDEAERRQVAPLKRRFEGADQLEAEVESAYRRLLEAANDKVSNLHSEATVTSRNLTDAVKTLDYVLSFLDAQRIIRRTATTN